MTGLTKFIWNVIIRLYQWMWNIAKEQKTIEKFDILGNLPVEISHEVLVRLTPEGIIKSFKCCKKWQKKMKSDYLWKSLNQKFDYDLDEEPNSEDYRKKFQSYSLHLQRRFMYNRYVECIVKNEAFREIPVEVIRQEFPFYNFVHFDDSTLILGYKGSSPFLYRPFEDINLFIINSSTGLVKHKIHFIYEAAIKHGNLLIAISNGFHLKIWNIETGECIIEAKLDDFNDNDRSCALLACKHLILIRAVRKKPKLINLYTFNMRTRQFSYLVDEWTDVCCTKDRIAIVKYTGSIEVMDPDFNSQMNLNCSTASRIYNSIMNDGFLAKLCNTPTQSSNLYVWNFKTKTNFKIRATDVNWITNIVLTSKETLLCVIKLVGLEIWDMSKQNRLFEIGLDRPSNEPILNDRYIFISSRSLIEPIIQIWCLRTGRLVKDFLSKGNPRQPLQAATNTKLLYHMEESGIDGRLEAWQICDYDYMSEVEHQ